jgi:hypothetical protein
MLLEHFIDMHDCTGKQNTIAQSLDDDGAQSTAAIGSGFLLSPVQQSTLAADAPAAMQSSKRGSIDDVTKKNYKLMQK